MIKRFDMNSWWEDDTKYTDMEPAIKGRWVHYQDYEEEVDALQHRILELELALEDYGDDGEE